MEKIKAVWRDNQLIFGHFIVKKESDHFVGVYQRYGSKCGPLVTSDTALKCAAKKAKLLEIGWRLGEENADAYHKEECRFCSR